MLLLLYADDVHDISDSNDDIDDDTVLSFSISFIITLRLPMGLRGLGTCWHSTSGSVAGLAAGAGATDDIMSISSNCKYNIVDHMWQVKYHLLGNGQNRE